MIIQKRNIEIPYNERVTIYGIGDIHLGTIHCDKTRLQSDIKEIQNNPYAYFVGMGDFCESITLSDSKRFEIDEIDPIFYKDIQTLACSQRDAFIELVEPIKDKCLGLLVGNHEYSNRKHHYVDIVLDACRTLNVPYLSDTAYIRLTIDTGGGHTEKLDIYAEHGHGGGRKAGGKRNSLEDTMGYFDADLYLRGHVHKKAVTRTASLYLNKAGKLVEKKKLGLLTGCYYKTYEAGHTSYGQRFGYSPTDIGCVKVFVKPYQVDMEAVI